MGKRKGTRQATFVDSRRETPKFRFALNMIQGDELRAQAVFVNAADEDDALRALRAKKGPQAHLFVVGKPIVVKTLTDVAT